MRCSSIAPTKSSRSMLDICKIIGISAVITRDVEVTGESLVPYGFGLSIEEAKGKKTATATQTFVNQKVAGHTGR